MRIQRHNRIAAQLAAALAAIFITLGPSTWAAMKAGDNLPDLTPMKLEGSLPAALKGKVVLLDFWASWCDPCKESFPVMQQLHDRYASQGLVVLAVNVDEKRSDMDAFLKKHPGSFPILRDASRKLVEHAGIATMPTSFLIDRQGKVRFVHSGFHGAETQKKYEQEIDSLLKP